MSRTWILTGSPENPAAAGADERPVIGFSERNHDRTLGIEAG